MKKQNLLVLCIVIALVAAVGVLAAVMPKTRTISEDAPSVDEAEMITVTESTQEKTDEEAPVSDELPAETSGQAEAFLVVSVRGTVYEPLPLAGEGVFTIRQDEDTTNTVHVTPTSVWMEHSTCDNQDCVDQGTVSLENMESRVLGNMIICLPNEVVLELHTAETLAGVFGTAE